MSNPKVKWSGLALLVGVVLIGLLARQTVGMAEAAYRNLGFIQLAAASHAPTTDASAASDWFLRGREIFPEDHRLWYALALSYRLQGKLDDARLILTRFVQEVPSDLAGRYVLGDIAYASGDVAAALQSWAGLTNGIVFIQKAADEIELGNLGAALKLLDIALGGDITAYSIAYPLAEQYTLLAAKLLALGNTNELGPVCDKGSTAFQAAVKAEPALGFVRINFGTFLRRCQRYQEAIAQFQSVDDSMKASARAWASHEIALTYRTLSQENSALRYFEQAVALEPQNGLYRLSLGQAYARMGQTEKACTELAQVISDGDPRWKVLAEEELAALK